MEFCQSCKKNEASVLETTLESVIPYHLCEGCHGRLLARSLRPLEYFNLASVHGHEYELHDDFYDDDGVACQPESEIEIEAGLEFPRLAEISNNIQKLIGYGIVKWWYPTEVSELLKEFDKNEILKEVDKKLEINQFLLERLLEIVSNVLGTTAESWLIYQYKNYTGEDPLIFAEAFAKCIPSVKGLDYVKEILSKEKPAELGQNILSLNYFNSKEVLNWIEENQDKVINVTNNFGDVCAANKFDWNTARRWLSLGRPLSLIALDAVLACGTTSEKANRSIFLRENEPRLLEPDSINKMNHVLEEYLKRDGVHRTKIAVDAIKKDWDDILKDNANIW